MKNKLGQLSEDIRNCMREMSSQASQQGVRVYLVGGIVRDIILGRKNFDLDFVTEGSGIKLGSAFSHQLKGQVKLHQRFGTATVTTENCRIDIVSARKETYHSCGCLPEVSLSTLKDDLFRRDFTINAMAIGINHDDYGKLIDCYGGYRDLKAGLIRILHKRSFIDDPTRIFRAIRFKERFHFRIEKSTLRLLKEAIDSDVLGYIDEHRIRNELILTFSEPSVRACVRTIQRLCGFNFLKKGYRLSGKDIGFLNEIGKSLDWYASLHEQVKTRECKSWLVYLCSVLAKLPPADLAVFCLNFGMSASDRKTIIFLPQLENLSRILGKKDFLPSAIYFALQPLSIESIVYLHARVRGHLRNYHEARARLKQYIMIWQHVRLHLNGEDLKRLKVHPQIMYNKILQQVLKRKIDGYIHSQGEEEQEALRAYATLKNSRE